MKRRISSRILNAVLTLVTLTGTLMAQDVKPVVTVTIKNVATIAENLPAMAEASKDAQASIGLMMFQSYVSQDAFKEAVDATRPAGLFLFPSEEEPIPAAIIPVLDIEKAFKLLPPNMKAVSTGENTWNIVLKQEEAEEKDADAEKKAEEKVAASVSFADGWCVLTNLMKDGPKGFDAAAMEALLVKDAADRDFGVTLFVNQIPEKDRQKVFQKFMEKLNGVLECKCPCMGNAMRTFFKGELEKLAASAEKNHYESPICAARLGYSWNADAKTLVISNQFVGNPEKAQIRGLSRITKGSETPLANFGTDALFSSQVNATIAEMNDPVVDKILAIRRDAMKQHVTKKLGEENAKPVIEFFEGNAKLFRDAAFNPVVEGASALYANENQLAVVCARVVLDGYALEKEFRKAVKYIGDKKKDKIEAHVKDTVRFEDGDLHVFQANFLPEKELQEEMKNLFKDGIPGCIIFAPKAVYYAAGTNATDLLLGIVKSDAFKPAEASVFSARVSLQNVLNVAAICGKITAEQRETLAKCGCADVTVKVQSLENGMEVLTEIPAPVFQVLTKVRDMK